LNRFKYFSSSFAQISPDQLFQFGGPFRKIQQYNAIWELLFGVDAMKAILTKTDQFLIDESDCPAFSQTRNPYFDWDPYSYQAVFGDSYSIYPEYPFEIESMASSDIMEPDIMQYSTQILLSPFTDSPSSPFSPSSSPSHDQDYPTSFSTTASSSLPSNWKKALEGGLTHTLTKSIPSSSSLRHLFPAAGLRLPRIRLMYILRKIAQWISMNDSTNEKTNQNQSLPKLNVLIKYPISRRQLHEALVEWYETLDPLWKIVPRLTDWVMLTQESKSHFEPPVTSFENLKHYSITFFMLMWHAITLVHSKSNDNELYSASVSPQKSTCLTRIYNINTIGITTSFLENSCPENVREPIFIGTSSEWCVLTFRSLVGLISKLCIYGEHPIIYGLTIPICLYSSMISLLREEPMLSDPTTTTNSSRILGSQERNNRDDEYETFQHSNQSVRLVNGITVDEVVDGVENQFIPYVTEIANIYVVAKTWINSMNDFVEKLKRMK